MLRTPERGMLAPGLPGSRALRSGVLGREPAIDVGLRRSRIESWGWDYLVVLVWLVLVFVAVGVPQLIGWIDLAGVWSRPLAADVAVTMLTVVPYLAYLAMTEAGRTHATWGKRRAGLTLEGPGGTITLGQALARNAVKVLPWQLGHMSAMRFAAGDEPTGSAVLLFVGSMIVLAAVVGPILVGRSGLHDLVAGTRVRAEVPTSERGATSLEPGSRPQR